MNRLALIGLVPFALAGPALAQTMDHSSMPGMAMPAAPAKPAAKKKPVQKKTAPAGHQHHDAPAAGAANPHAGHDMPAAAPMAPGMTMPQTAPTQDHSAMPGMEMAPSAPAAMTMGEIEVPAGAPPAPPSDYAADHLFPPTAMAAARRQLRREHGGGETPYAKVMANLLEYGAGAGANSYRWSGEAWLGGDIHRLVLKSEGEGKRAGGIESAELQALYSRAVGVYTDLQIGVRQDFEPHARTYLTVGAESLLPYWFEAEGAAFLSDKGDLSARIEGSYDLRLTSRLLLQPRAELNFAVQNDAATQTGSGLSDAELGLRLRYEIRREFAPYVGVSYERKFGRTADYSRAAGDDVEDTRLVFGVRAWF